MVIIFAYTAHKSVAFPLSYIRVLKECRVSRRLWFRIRALVLTLITTVRVVFHHKKKIRKIRRFEIRDPENEIRSPSNFVETRFAIFFGWWKKSRISKCRIFRTDFSRRKTSLRVVFHHKKKYEKYENTITRFVMEYDPYFRFQLGRKSKKSKYLGSVGNFLEIRFRLSWNPTRIRTGLTRIFKYFFLMMEKAIF